jgi:tetratricopeptide (TPR) repeat protein
LAAVHCFPIAPASAQEPSPKGMSERVDDLLARGIEGRQEGRDAEALELFRRANSLDPANARVLAHLGATYQALGRWVSAHTYLTRALEQREDGYIQRHRAELEEALATVGEHVGFLEINGAPDGAEALISGQLIATLPMSSPVPIIVGSYLLEVRFKGHYTLGRPITVSQRVLTREEVELAPHRLGDAPDGGKAAATSTSESEQGSGGARWAPWALGGLSAAATATTLIAWQRREHYADRWNDDAACLGVGISREERCGDELDRGQQAQTVLWVSGVAAGVFAAGAVITAIWPPNDAPEQVSALRCAPGWGGASCFGTF